MGKPPYFPFFPLDWLRDTGSLSPLATHAWINIIAYAWHEPKVGVYERSREAFCRQVRIDPKDLLPILKELTSVASVTASNDKVTVVSRRLVNINSSYENNAIRQSRFRRNAKSNALVTPSNENVTDKKLEVRSQKEKEEERDKQARNAESAPSPASPKGPTPTPIQSNLPIVKQVFPGSVVRSPLQASNVKPPVDLPSSRYGPPPGWDDSVAEEGSAYFGALKKKLKRKPSPVVVEVPF
jgi:hypothetical protein